MFYLLKFLVCWTMDSNHYHCPWWEAYIMSLNIRMTALYVISGCNSGHGHELLELPGLPVLPPGQDERSQLHHGLLLHQPGGGLVHVPRRVARLVLVHRVLVVLQEIVKVM